jgi:hypothetical protein
VVVLVFLLVMVGGGATAASAQTVTDTRVWAGLSLQARLGTDSPWRVTLDTQVRSRDVVDALEQWYVRPSVSRELSAHSTVTAGYAFFRTTPASGGALHEHRVWQQYSWSSGAAGGTISTRSRLEQRHSEGNDRLSWRLRQQLRFVRLLKAGSRWSAVIWDEASAHLNSTQRYARGFDQNRAFAGLSVALSTRARVESGYQNQWVHVRGGANRMNHILSGVLTLLF